MNTFLKIIMLSYAGMGSLCALEIPDIDDPTTWEEYHRWANEALTQHPSQTPYSAAALIPENFEPFANQPSPEALPAWPTNNWDNTDILSEFLENERYLSYLSSSPPLPSSPTSEEEQSSDEPLRPTLKEVQRCFASIVDHTRILNLPGITSVQFFINQSAILSTFEANVLALAQLEPSKEKDFLCWASILLLHEQLKALKNGVLNTTRDQLFASLTNICQTYEKLSFIWEDQKYHSTVAQFCADFCGYTQSNFTSVH